MSPYRNRSVGQDIAAVVCGVALGTLGSRLLPPLMASATGSVRARFGEDPFERLKQDHRALLAILERMLRVPANAVSRRGTLFLSLKRTLGKHALAEEDVVYPLLHGEARAADAAKQLYSEHADMKILLYELESALKTTTGWEERVSALRDLMGRHIREEEDVEFPKLKALLDGRQGRILSGQIHREEALIL
jgi:iron-sulfur cluster repair protein YtfE (RIC family)